MIVGKFVLWKEKNKTKRNFQDIIDSFSIVFKIIRNAKSFHPCNFWFMMFLWQSFSLWKIAPKHIDDKKVCPCLHVSFVNAVVNQAFILLQINVGLILVDCFHNKTAAPTMSSENSIRCQNAQPLVCWKKSEQEKSWSVLQPMTKHSQTAVTCWMFCVAVWVWDPKSSHSNDSSCLMHDQNDEEGDHVHTDSNQDCLDGSNTQSAKSLCHEVEKGCKEKRTKQWLQSQNLENSHWLKSTIVGKSHAGWALLITNNSAFVIQIHGMIPWQRIISCFASGIMIF